MKRLLLFLSVLLSVTLMAQSPIRTKTYTFDFSNPEQLSPSITRSPYEGGGVVVPLSGFTTPDGSVTLSFDNSNTVPMSDIRIVTDNAANLNLPYLTFDRSVIVTASTTDAILVSLRIPTTDMIGGLRYESTSPIANVGSFGLSSAHDWNEWVNVDNKSVTSLSLLNASPLPPAIRSIEVSYMQPRDVLQPTQVSIANNAVIPYFSSIDLTFSKSMTVTSDARYRLTKGSESYDLTASAQGNVVTLSASEPITSDGNYTLTVIAGSFEDTDYDRNEELVYHFEIVRSFDILSVTPTPGSVDDIPATITLTFDGTVGTVNGTLNVDVLDANGNLVRRGHAANGTQNNQVIVEFNNTTPISSNGIYTLVIPKGLVTDVAEKHQNEKTTYNYNIGHIASDELKAYAQQLLAFTGIGYPKSNAQARTTLANMPANSSTDAYNTAIANYLQATDVEMPVSGNYYYLKAVAQGGAQLYVGYANGLVSLTSSVANAAPFRVEGSVGNYSFMTPDNNYLLLPSPSSGVSNTATNLTIAKLNVSGATDEEVFGLFSLYGSYQGTDAYALANMSGSFATNPGLGLRYFTSTLTNGFALEAVPDANIPVEDAIYTLTPASGTSSSQLTSITVSFQNIQQVSLANKNLISLVGGGSQVAPSSVTLVPGKTNEYVLTFVDVKMGDYTLNIAKGAFTYNYPLPNGNVIVADVQAITGTYKVTTGDDYQYDFTQKFNIYPVGSISLPSPIKDVELNNLMFYSNDTNIGVSNKVVNIVNYNTAEVVGSGVFRVVEKDSLYPNAKGIIKLEMTTPVVAESLPAAQYAYIIKEGTFGDKNFGEYNADPAKFLASGKTKADCHANPYIYYILAVNNAEPEPGPAEEHPSEEVLQKAKDLLAKTGVGYPTENASARIILKNLVDKNLGSDDIFNNAMLSYLGSDEVQMPKTDQYYQLVAVSADGHKAYVQADGSITANASKAASFLATTSGNSISLKTANGKYLTVLTSQDNLTAEPNNLVLRRMPVGNNQLEKAFGLLAITGVKNEASLWSKVDVLTPAITTSDNAFVFTDAETSGFSFVEAEPFVPGPIGPTEEMLAEARQELAKTGVGYPVTDSKARLALQQLVESGSCTVDEFNKAFEAYKAETNVVRPATGKFYRIYAQTLSSEKVYLRYDAKDGVLLTSDAMKASPFMVTVNRDGTTCLQAFDDKYLTLSSAFGPNVSDAAAYLFIDRLVGNSLSSSDTYGLMGIYGEMGYATVDASNFAFRNSMRSPVLTTQFTSGFGFEETVKGEGEDVDFTLEPARNTEVESLDSITLTFDSKVMLANKDLISLTYPSGEKFVLAPQQSEGNKFVMNFINLEKGTYTLTIEEGAFTTSYFGELRPVKKITANYTLTKSVEFAYGYEEGIQLTWVENPGDDYVMDTELNTFTLVSSVPLMFNPDKAVIIRNSGIEVARGHMISADLARASEERLADYTYSLVLDKPIAEGALTAGDYEYVFAKESFGDGNFGVYLAQPATISKASCHVNNELVFTAKVDNDKASVRPVPYMVSPGAYVVDSLNVVTVAFDTDEKVTLADQSLFVFTTDDKAVAIKDIKETAANTFELTFVNLTMGDYNLTVKTGAFTVNHNGKERKVEGFELRYYLIKSVEFAYGYEKDILLTWLQNPNNNYVKDTDLNQFTLVSNVPLVFNPNKAVVLKNVITGEEVARGHMEMVPVDGARALEASTDDYVYGLVLNKAITEGSISDGTYKYVFEEESFGDDNYGAYLDSPTTVSKSACHVNNALEFVVMVNNMMVGIREVVADVDDEPIYDVYGRKVTGQLKKGQIYIKNGKKFMKK